MFFHDLLTTPETSPCFEPQKANADDWPKYDEYAIGIMIGFSSRRVLTIRRYIDRDFLPNSCAIWKFAETPEMTSGTPAG